MIDNGPRCTVNGLASIIDPDYNLYRLNWTFSSCADPLGLYEGVELSGFALAIAAPAAPAGSFYVLMTGRTVLGIYGLSAVFEPV